MNKDRQGVILVEKKLALDVLRLFAARGLTIKEVKETMDFVIRYLESDTVVQLCPEKTDFRLDID